MQKKSKDEIINKLKHDGLSVDGDDKKIGLGNWRGSKIGGYDIVSRIKRKQDTLISDGVA